MVKRYKQVWIDPEDFKIIKSTAALKGISMKQYIGNVTKSIRNEKPKKTKIYLDF